MLKTYLYAREATVDLKSRLAKLRNDDSGAAMIEYALLVGLVAIGGIAALTLLGTNISGALGRIGGHLTAIN